MEMQKHAAFLFVLGQTNCLPFVIWDGKGRPFKRILSEGANAGLPLSLLSVSYTYQIFAESDPPKIP